MGELDMNLTIIASDRPTNAYAAYLTRNALVGSPIKIARKRMQDGEPLQAIWSTTKLPMPLAAMVCKMLR